MLDKKTFDKFRQLIYRESGIALSGNKESLVSARVAKRMRELGIATHAAYYDFISREKDGQELVHLLDVISTNVTHFFREPRHFEVLGEIVREWEQQGQRRYCIWCAASSTGEEPYSIAITLRESLREPRDVNILASDISTRVLQKAKEGIFEARHVENIPRALLLRHFQKGRGESDGLYRVNQNIREMVVYRRINLSHPSLPVRGPLDLIFCRNVMIYFDNTIRRRLLANLYALLRPGGYLIVGHAESLSGMLSEFKSVEPAVYVKPPGVKEPQSHHHATALLNRNK